MKVLPAIVTALPLYATAGVIPLNAGRATITSALLALETIIFEGLLNVTSSVQLPAAVKFPVTATMIEGLKTEHTIAVTPQTSAEQFCPPTIKLLPAIVMVLPA